MPYPDDNAIEEGSTPLNNGPETAQERNFVHRFDNDQGDDYVDPVTKVNQRRPDADEIEARADAAEAAEEAAD